MEPQNNQNSPQIGPTPDVPTIQPDTQQTQSVTPAINAPTTAAQPAGNTQSTRVSSTGQSMASIVATDKKKISKNAKLMIILGVPLIIVGTLVALLGTLVGLLFVLLGAVSIVSGIVSLKKAK